MASKIIVLGGIEGQLRAAFTKLAKLQAKQNFAFAIVVGNLFSDGSREAEAEEISALLQGTLNVPLPTYFTIGDRALPARIVEKIEADDEVCENLYFLGKRGTLKTSEGIRITALGGTFERGDSKSKPESNASGKFQTTYHESDARALYGIHNTDILITSQWPRGIRFRSKAPLPDNQSLLPAEIQCVADVCASLKPRYHFSASNGFFYEREPFFHMSTEENPDIKQLTRFISVATFGAKEKAMYAFSLDPKAGHPTSVPAGVTASPLSTPQSKRTFHSTQKEAFQRFAKADGNEGHRENKRQQRAPPPGPDQCFFCLSNANVATHLITSIGNESYLTTAKGPLPPANFFSSLSFPGHMLIIPFSHSPTLNSIQDPESRSSTWAEMQKYRTALQNLVSDRSSGKLGAVTWEVNRGNNIHTHWQFMPVPVELIRDGLVEAAFKVEAENLKYPRISSIPADESKGADEPGDFFRLWIWNSEDSADADSKPSENILLLELTPDFRFDLQFGRRVMAKLLQLDQRMHWKDAIQSVSEEEADAEAFKEAFKPFDFSLE